MDQGYSSNNANGEEEGKPRSILNKEMAEAGNFNIKNRIKSEARPVDHSSPGKRGEGVARTGRGNEEKSMER